MFDVSLVELALVGLVALLVLGPEKLPRAARTVGLYVRKAKQTWYSVRSDIERELAADELKRSMKQAADSVREATAIESPEKMIERAAQPNAAPDKSADEPPSA
jgi:sec-independent protein translocase protein TatB